MVFERRWLVTVLVVLTAAIIGCGSGDDAISLEEGESDSGGTQPTASATDATSFSLLSTNGGVVNFSDLRGTVPVSVFFYGGARCEGCEDRLRLLQDSYERFKEAGAELIAISTDLPEKTRSTVEEIGVEFPVLSDVDGSVSDSWGVFNILSNGHAAPSLVLFSSSGDEIARQVASTASELPGIDEMLQTIQRSAESGTAQSTATPRSGRSGLSSASGQVSLGPGVTDFRLPDAIGDGEVSLSETLRERNVVLVFYRAFW